MIETIRITIPATPEQIFALVYKSVTLRKKCPKVRLEQGPTTKTLDICAESRLDVDNGKRIVDEIFEDNGVAFYSQTVPLDQLTNNAKYIALKRQHQLQIIPKKEIEGLLPLMLKQGFLEAYTEIDRRLRAMDNICAVISDSISEVKVVFNQLFEVKTENRAVADGPKPTLLQADPVRIETRNINKKMPPQKSDYELDLKLSNKDLFIAYLCDLVTKQDERDNIILFDRFDRLNARGDKDTCEKVKKQLRTQIDGLYLLLIETKHLTDVNQLEKEIPKEWRTRFFTKQKALDKCDQLIAQYYICEPKLILEEVSSNMEVAVFIVAKEFKKQFMRHVRKFTKSHNKQVMGGDQRGVQNKDADGGFFTVSSGDYDDKEFKEYLNDMRLGTKEVVVHTHDGKTTIRVTDAKHVHSVEDYVRNVQCTLVPKVESKVIERFVNEKQPIYRTVDIQLGVGYTRYPDNQLFKEFMKKQEVKDEILQNTALESVDKKHKVYFLKVKGMRNVVNKVINEFDHYRKTSLAPNQQEWVVALPAYLENNFVSIDRLITDHLEAESEKIKKYVQLQRSIKKGWVYIATFPQETPPAGSEILKETFTQCVEKGLHSATINGFQNLRDIASIPSLSQRNDLIEHDNKVKVVSFGNIGDILEGITKLVEEAKQSKEIFIGINTYAIVKGKIEQYPKYDDVKMKIREAKDGMMFCIEGLPHRVKPIDDKLKKDLEEAEGGMKTETFEVNKEEYFLLKNSVNIVEQLKKQHDIMIEVVEQKHDVTALIRLGNFNKLELVADGIETIAPSKLRVYTSLNDIENPQFKAAATNHKEYYNKDLNLLYLATARISELLSIAFLKKSDICLTVPQGMEINAAITDIVRYLEEFQDQPTVVLCTRSNNPAEVNSLEKRIEWILKDRSLKSLNIMEDSWQYEETKDMFRQYNDKVRRIINSTKSAKVVVSSSDLDITESSPVYIEQQRSVVYLPGNGQVRLQQERDRYYFEFNGSKCYFAESDTAMIDRSKSYAIKCCWYELDFNRKTQTNLFTQAQKRIELMKVKAGSQVSVAPASSTYLVKITTEKSRVERLKKTVKERIEKALKGELKHQETIKYPNKIISRQQFERLCEEGCLLPCPGEKESNDGVNMEVKVIGYSDKDIQQLKNQLQVMINNRGTSTFSYPKHWSVNTNDIDQIEVDRNSDEFRNIQNEFKIAHIMKLTRIQNTFLWKKYCQEKQNQEELTMLPPREIMLFHGTKLNAPEKIYLDKEESFKINYAADSNMFGRGIYFAKEASYSDSGYAFQTATGTKEMLYCKVNVGECQVMQSHEGRPDMKDTDIRDHNRNIRYGCRKSNYQGSDIYIIYSTGRAYPEYLIEYSNTVPGYPQQNRRVQGTGTYGGLGRNIIS